MSKKISNSSNKSTKKNNSSNSKNNFNMNINDSSKIISGSNFNTDSDLYMYYRKIHKMIKKIM